MTDSIAKTLHLIITSLLNLTVTDLDFLPNFEMLHRAFTTVVAFMPTGNVRRKMDSYMLKLLRPDFF